MNRLEFQKISGIRLREARLLLKSGHFQGAYYLLGYSIECALKACISKQFKKHDFPDKKVVNDSYTHDLEKLLRISGLKTKLDADGASNPSLAVNWAVIKDWNECYRYEASVPESVVRDCYSACTARKNGLLPWLKKEW